MTTAVTGRLWKVPPALMQLLALSPLLAVNNTVVHAIGLGIATLIVLACSSLCISLVRHQLAPATRLLVFVLLCAAFTTCVELLMQAYVYSLYQTLGIYTPLIACNLVLLARAEDSASRLSPLPALLAGLKLGSGFLLLLTTLGAIRELLGTGTLFANFDRLLPVAAGWKLQLFHPDTPFLLALLPAGALLLLGLMIALKQVITPGLTEAQPFTATEPPAAGSKRVRVTGKI